jgi:hypothetical protein
MKTAFNSFWIFLMAVTLTSVVYAQSAEGDYFSSSIFYRGDVSFNLDKSVYNPGDVLSADVTVYNMEDFPVTDAFLVLELVSGGEEHIYPSQSSDADNVFSEQVIGGIDLAANGRRVVPFSYKIPGDLKSGAYRLEAYYVTARTPIVGIPAIFISPRYAVFRVDGAGQFPDARIIRTLTVFINETGPVGVGVMPGSVVNGSVYVQNDGSSGLSGLSLEVAVCEWDDSSCAREDSYWSKTYSVPSIAPAGMQNVDVRFDAPAEPGAYAIRLELKDNAGRTVSLYRSRIVVMGETAKIRKLAVTKTYLPEGGNGSIMVLAAASPDHYSMPVVENVKVSVSVFGMDLGDEIYSDSYVIPQLAIASVGLVSKVFNYTAPRELKGFKVCSKIESQAGELYDQFCYSVDPLAVGPSGDKISEISVDWSYNAASGVLDVNMCSADVSGLASKSSAAAILLNADGKVVGAVENVSLDSCGVVSFSVVPGDYVLLVNELGSGGQTRYDVVAAPSAVPSMVCGDGICVSGEDSGNCCVDCGCIAGSDCVGGSCVVNPGQVKEEPGILGGNNIYYMAALLVLIIAVLFYATKAGKQAK